MPRRRGAPHPTPATATALQFRMRRMHRWGARVRFRNLRELAGALTSHPVSDQTTPLHHLRLTDDLKLAVNGTPLHITADALGHLVRVQAGMAGIAGSGWLAWRRGPDPVPEAGAREHHALVDQVNRSLQGQTRQVTVRMVGDTVIAVRTSAYACLSHAEVLQALTGHGLQRMAWAAWTRRGLDVALYLNSPAFDLGGDPYYGGVHVTHSETGNGRLMVRGYLFRWACSNGTVFGVRHQRLFAARSHRGDRDQLMACLHLAVGESISHLGDAADRLRRLQVTPLTDHHLRYLEQRVRRDVGKGALRKVQQQLSQLEFPSAYAAYNAVTAVARDYHGRNRLQLELLGGQFMDQALRMARQPTPPRPELPPVVKYSV